MTKLMFIFLGSGIGGVCRFGLTACAIRACKGWAAFPLGTLVVNVAGCFIIGMLASFFAMRGKDTLHEDIRIGLTVGLIGGFTTFSAFSLETFRLFEDNQPTRAALNITLSITLGIAAVALGHRLTTLWLMKG